jgi:hypothetical protein
MTTYPIRDAAGTLFAFEIENAYVFPSTIVTLVRSVEGVSGVWQRPLFRRPMDIHVRFRYLGVPFMVWEPYGDSSRYWIGPDDDCAEHQDIAPIRSAFDVYTPPLPFRVIGYLVGLKFLELFRRQ